MAIIFDHSAPILEAILAACESEIEDIVHAIEDSAAETAPVETGSMSDGYYVVTAHEDGYQEAVSAASAANPKAHIVEHVDSNPDRFHAWVSNCVEHAVYVELGTYKMAAQPTLGPAIEAHAQDFADGVSTSIQQALRRFP